MKSILRNISLVVASLLMSSGSASAGTVLFNFDTLASGVNSGGIQTYMQAQLTGGTSVTVSSTGTMAAVTDRTYDGDDHVVGTCGSSSCTSSTLGTDTFIRNTSSALGWSFTFSGMLIDQVKFDYEIFPNAECPILDKWNCGGNASGGIYPNQPDFKFSTNLGNVFTYYGLTPGTGCSGPAGNPCASTSTKSPLSGPGGTEKAPQLIGNTGWLNVGGATTLTFLDWPSLIGIDNLYITFRVPPPTSTAAMPEPGTMLLLGSGLAAAYARRRRKQASVR